jgi:hypothetical protein
MLILSQLFNLLNKIQIQSMWDICANNAHFESTVLLAEQNSNPEDVGHL